MESIIARHRRAGSWRTGLALPPAIGDALEISSIGRECKRARCGGELCDVETLRTRDKTATPPASWSRDQIRRVAALEELRKD